MGKSFTKALFPKVWAANPEFARLRVNIINNF